VIQTAALKMKIKPLKGGGKSFTESFTQPIRSKPQIHSQTTKLICKKQNKEAIDLLMTSLIF